MDYRSKPIRVQAVPVDRPMELQTRDMCTTVKEGDWILTTPEGDCFVMEERVFRLLFEPDNSPKNAEP